MKKLFRTSVSGILGIVIVIGLFLMMFSWLSHDKSVALSTESNIEFVNYKEAIKPEKPLKIVEVQKKKREKPILQEAPNLELTETGIIESGLGGNNFGNALVIKFGEVLASIADASQGDSHTGKQWKLDTEYLAKDYEHNFKFPDKAKKAGLTQGQIITRAFFNKNNEFQRFEILKEEPVNYFRDVLYEMRFIKNNFKSSKNQKFAGVNSAYKVYIKDEDDAYSVTYKFIFDINSSEPVKFYSGGFNTFKSKWD
jgi:hypothetical protein